MADPARQKESMQHLLTAYSGALREYRATLNEQERADAKEQWSATFESLGIDFNAENRLVAIATLVAIVSSGETGLDPQEVSISHLMALLDSFLR